MSSESPAQAHRLFHRMQLAAHRLKKSADRLLELELPITAAQASVLAILEREGSISQGAVAERLSLHESAITTMVRRLLAAEYIERTIDPNDRRSRRLAITPRGLDALAGAQDAFGKVNATIDSALTGADVGRMADLLDRLIEAFEHSPGPGTRSPQPDR